MTQQDPRFKNTLPQSETIQSYLLEYATSLSQGLAQLDPHALNRALDLIQTTSAQGKQIFVAGNGGSAAIADHLCCDFAKGTAAANHPSLKVHSLVGSTSLFTALANDFSYTEVFSKQLDYFASAGDIVILISSSGNSPNIVQAIEIARSKGLKVIGLSGFSGGKLKEMADIPLYVPINNYGIVEDSHQMIMHVLAQYIARKRDGK